MTERVTGVPIWVLHRRAYRESSLLVDALSAEYGRAGLIARGHKKARGSRLEPFAPLLVSWVRRGDLGTLREVEAAGAPLRLQGEALWCGFYLNELLLRLLPRDYPNPEVFAAYGVTLDGLSAGRSREVLRRFEWTLLDALGYGFDPSRTAAGDPVTPDAGYCWAAGRGIAPGVPGAENLVAGRALLALVPGSDDASIVQTRPLLAAALQEHLGARPLHTVTMLRRLRSAERDAPRA